MKFTSNLIFLLVSSLCASTVCAGPPNKVWKGPSKSLGKGEISTYVEFDVQAKEIVEVGIEFTASMLDDLPTEVSDGKYDIATCDYDPDPVNEMIGPWFCCGFEVELEFPKQAYTFQNSARNGQMVFDHLVMNYNPQGNGPPGTDPDAGIYQGGPYSESHFDFHFYLIDRDTRLSVQPLDGCSFAPLDNFFAGTPIPMSVEDYNYLMEELPCDQIPPKHTYIPAVEPAMGAHMVDFCSPEYTGQSFSTTWIFGRQGGHLSFLEPMMTVDYLQDRNFAPQDIVLPEKAPKQGQYPQKYEVKFDYATEVYKIALHDFTWKEESVSGKDCAQPYPGPLSCP